MTESIINDAELVAELGHVDRSALAYFTCAQILSGALPSPESVPLLGEAEYAVLVDRIRGHAHDLRELAGERGKHLWASCQ